MKKDKINPHFLAIEAIKHNGGKAPISEVIDYILAKKDYSGLTPRKTVNALLHRSRFISVVDGLCIVKTEVSSKTELRKKAK
jgi:hypothetical protein